MQEYANTIDNPIKRVKETANHFNKNMTTTRKYLNMSILNINALDKPVIHKNKTRVLATAPYFNLIYKMLRDSIPPIVIFSYVMKKGYTDSYKKLQNTIEYIAKNNFNWNFRIRFLEYQYITGTIVIKRFDILKEITAKEKKNIDIQNNLEAIKKVFPIVEVISNIYNDFHSALMGKDTTKIDEFVAKHENKKDENGVEIISPISSFIESIKKDITPIKNAISFVESSGFVEGNNCKFKLIKRILYGRANLVNLFKKCFLCFSYKKKDFNLKNCFSLSK